MKQNQKEIAGIINKCYTPTEDCLQIKINIAIKLADHYEREDNKRKEREIKQQGYFIRRNSFDRKQFLKECGLDETKHRR